MSTDHPYRHICALHRANILPDMVGWIRDSQRPVAAVPRIGIILEWPLLQLAWRRIFGRKRGKGDSRLMPLPRTPTGPLPSSFAHESLLAHRSMPLALR